MKPIIALLFIALVLPLSAEEKPRQLLITKFALKRIEKANLTKPQRIAFDALTNTLRKEIHELRRESGIDQEVIEKRDNAHKSLTKLELEEPEYWKRLQAEAKLTDAQTAAFKVTQDKFSKYKEDVNDILTDEQQTAIRKRKKGDSGEE